MRIQPTHLPFVLAFCAALTTSARDAGAQPGPGPGMTPMPGNPPPGVGPVLFPQAAGLRAQHVFDGPAPPIAAPVGDEETPSGYRFKYEYNVKEIITGASIFGLSYTATTLAASGIAAGGFAAALLPVGVMPLLGPYPMAAFAAGTGAGPGTVAGIVALGVGQAIGFGLMIHGIASRKKIGFAPLCGSNGLERTLTLTPMAAPNAGGMMIGGAL